MSFTNNTIPSEIEVISSPLCFPFLLPIIGVPPLLVLSEVPLRERRGFNEFITIIPSAEFLNALASKPARGQLEPRAGALPRRRRTTSAASQTQPPIVSESKNFDFGISPFEDSSDNEN
ncbi:hypothetical protein D9757_013538 [Collybiopsis confluens]|uniref:Uncharacterized protein n=1 Tax=Collybiopsis confluens TaxID=2823264 RepID=A0A8H5CZF7_9AGAR|nr:hypothetical protein D9757_013538 [Collybiopsis confluens]